MLNYVWLGILFIGLAAAVTTDITDSSRNVYKNNTSVNALFVSSAKGEMREGKLIISKADYNSAFNENTETDISFPAVVTSNAKTGAATFYSADAGKNAPAFIKKIAAANAKESDLTGKVKILASMGDTLKCSVMFEEVSFVKMKEVTSSALKYADTAVSIALGLIGIMAMWLGVMKVADTAGVINFIARVLKPVTKRLFPEVPSDHPAMGAMIMNISANFLGLSNAATPFGLKAMEELDKLNPNKGVATNAMCTFLAINTAGMTLIPATAIAIRASSGSAQPAIIIGTSLFGSFCATLVGITTVKLLERFPIPRGEGKQWFEANKRFLFGLIASIAVILVFSFSGVFKFLLGGLKGIDPETIKNGITLISTLAIPALITVFIGAGAIKKVKVYEVFVEGAKEGFNIAIRIIPYLVAMLMAIGIFRAGGAMEWLIYILRFATEPLGMPAEALPMALMRPLSGSGSLGIMTEVIKVYGPDSFIGILTSTFYGSSETTFYVLAVYFGAVNIRKTRHALPAGLLADVAGVLGALFIVKLLFT